MLEAFGAAGRPTPLSGGQGLAWRVGDLVLTSAAHDETMLAWLAGVLGSVDPAVVRVAPPVRSSEGGFMVDGWSATPWLAGRHEPGRWRDIVAAGVRFHDAVAGVDAAAVVAARTDRWATADRMAWGEAPLGDHASHPHVARLVAGLRPIELPTQLVHGDLTGNVLFVDGLPPAVIDIPPIVRPRGFAAAIVVADALVWEGAAPDLVDVIDPAVARDQLLARALLARMLTDLLADPAADLVPYAGAVEVAAGMMAAEPQA